MCMTPRLNASIFLTAELARAAVTEVTVLFDHEVARVDLGGTAYHRSLDSPETPARSSKR